MDLNSDFWKPRTRPTMYFVGVTTGKSSIRKVFPKWAEILGLSAAIEGYMNSGGLCEPVIMQIPSTPAVCAAK